MLFILISPGLRSGTLRLLELFGALEAFSGGVLKVGGLGKEPSRITLFLNSSLGGQRAALLDERERRALRRRSTGMRWEYME